MNMNGAVERLTTLCVADVMRRDVVRVSINQTIRDAAALLVAHQISTLPVVDEMDRCVGILSATDFARREAGDCRGGVTRAGAAIDHVLARERQQESFHVDHVARDRVACHMSAAVQSIESTASLLDAGRMMCAAHLHRLPVMDRRGRLAGMVSSLDLVAAMVQAIEE